jgi:hypothetical protein
MIGGHDRFGASGADGHGVDVNTEPPGVAIVVDVVGRGSGFDPPAIIAISFRNNHSLIKR